MMNEQTINKDRGSLKNALAVTRRTGQCIGCVVREWGAYKLGDFVIVEDYGPALCVEMPMSPEYIAASRERIGLLQTFLTIIGVPKPFVQIVLE